MSVQHTPSKNEEILFAENVAFGAEQDKIDVGNLWKWTVITIVFVLTLIGTGYQLYTYFSYQIGEKQANETQYDALVIAQEATETRLNSSGVVDETKGVYHIPVDKAIDLTVQAYQTK